MTVFAIPYGCGRWAEGWLRLAADGMPDCAVPHVVIDPARRRPLRLSDGQYAFAGAPPMDQLRDPAGLLDFVGGYLKLRADPWVKLQAELLAAYLAFALARVDAEREALAARIAPFGDLYRPRDWVFSAWRPLPRAWIATRPGAFGEDSMVKVDLAFWTGERVLAVELLTGAALSRGREDERARLRAAGVEIVDLDGEALRADPEAALMRILPAPAQRFWEGLPFPSGPIKVAALTGFTPPAGGA